MFKWVEFCNRLSDTWSYKAVTSRYRVERGKVGLGWIGYYLIKNKHILLIWSDKSYLISQIKSCRQGGKSDRETNPWDGVGVGQRGCKMAWLWDRGGVGRRGCQSAETKQRRRRGEKKRRREGEENETKVEKRREPEKKREKRKKERAKRESLGFRYHLFPDGSGLDKTCIFNAIPNIRPDPTNTGFQKLNPYTKKTQKICALWGRYCGYGRVLPTPSEEGV